MLDFARQDKSLYIIYLYKILTKFAVKMITLQLQVVQI